MRMTYNEIINSVSDKAFVLRYSKVVACIFLNKIRIRKTQRKPLKICIFFYHYERYIIFYISSSDMLMALIFSTLTFETSDFLIT